MNFRRVMKKLELRCRKHSPEMLIIAGTIGIVGSCVMACKATTKLSEILDDAKEQIDEIEDAVEHPERLPQEYTTEMAKSDTTKVKLQTGMKIAKLYAPSVALGTLSLVSIITSHNILRKRNAALAIAYATLDDNFKKYRERVVDRFGEALDRELRYNVKTKVIEETAVDEKGKEKKVSKTIDVVENITPSEFCCFFDESSPNWTESPEYNKSFLINQQNYFNDKLRADGFVFLNDVRRALGVPLLRKGQTYGWIYRDTGSNDGYIDFNIFDVHKKEKRDFVTGYEPSILLDFNVDGPIVDLFNLDPWYS